MALKDYMPYGAPELLDAAPERMARSTMMASLFVALLVATLGTITSRQVQVPVEPRVVIDPTEWVNILDPPPPASDVPPVDLAPPQGEPDANSLVKVRPDELVPPDDFKSFDPPAGVTGPGPWRVVRRAARQWVRLWTSSRRRNTFVYTDEMPALVRAVEPRYPDLAREAGVEGTVKVQILVGLDGRVIRAIIAPHGSIPMLDEAALEAARASVFTPALANGKPVKVWVGQQYRFRLH
jgi:protein TonB